jgi:uncharacterized protein
MPKVERYLTRTTPEGVVLRMPVGTIVGDRPGPRVTVLAGQHGTEYAGIEAAMRLYRTLDAADVAGEVAIAMVVNEVSFMDWTQFAPTPPEVKEMMLEVSARSDAIVNLHGGEFIESMYPYIICRLIGDDAADRLAMEMAEVFGFPLISISRYRGDPPPMPDGQRPAWWLWPRKSIGDELRVPEIVPEFGETGSREDGPVVDGIVNVLRLLGVLSGEARRPAERPRVIGDRHWITAKDAGVFYPSVRIGDAVTEGQPLGEVRDYFGRVLETPVAPGGGMVINANVGMPVKTGGFLLWIGEIGGNAE